MQRSFGFVNLLFDPLRILCDRDWAEYNSFPMVLGQMLVRVLSSGVLQFDPWT